MKDTQFLILVSILSYGFELYISAITAIVLAIILAFRK